MKSHYELLGVEPSADVETIKKAFRREIARYHPDKVVHLGPEFQEIASTRATELTAAYTTLTNLDKRTVYDRELASKQAPSPVAPPPPAASPQARPAPPGPEPTSDASGGGSRFAQERVGRDDIVRRAALERVRAGLKNVIGECDFVSVKGFDLACLSRGKSSLFRRAAPPSVLVRLAPLVDSALVAEAWMHAVKARLEQKPLVLLLLGDRLAPTSELGQAVEENRRKNPALVDAVFPVPVDLRDWSPKTPASAPKSVRDLVEALKNYAS